MANKNADIRSLTALKEYIDLFRKFLIKEKIIDSTNEEYEFLLKMMSDSLTIRIFNETSAAKNNPQKKVDDMKQRYQK